MKYCDGCGEDFQEENEECPQCLYYEVIERLGASFDAVYHVRNHLVDLEKKARRMALPENKKYLVK